MRISLKEKVILILVILIAFVLRFYGLGKYPQSLDWDEASLGYNAYSILKTARDEYGYFLPFQFKSFGDYKPPLYVYLTVPSVLIFGLTEFAVRFPSALFGVLATFTVYFLVRALFPRLKSNYYLLITFLFAVSPWSLQFSRVAFEANVGLFWFILGTLLFINFPRHKYSLFLAVVSFALGIYSYHSLRLVVPVFAVGLLFLFKEEVLSNLKSFLLAGLLAVFLLTPVLLLLGQGVGARFSSVSNIKPESLTTSINQIDFDNLRGDKIGKLVHNRRIIYFLGIVKGYLDHWNPNFLFVEGDGIDRHHAPDVGMLYFVELPFVLLGIYTLLFLPVDIRGKKITFWWFLVAPLAASLTTGTPHPVRALLYLPTYQIFAAFGIKKMLEMIHKEVLYKTLVVVITLLFTLNIYYYLDLYYKHGPLEQAEAWQYGYKQAVEEVARRQSDYDKVIITTKYDQPYIYFLFYEKIDPLWYQNSIKDTEVDRWDRQFGKYRFTGIDWGRDKNLKNTLLVGTPGEIPQDASVVSEINFPDGRTAFRLAGF